MWQLRPGVLSRAAIDAAAAGAALGISGTPVTSATVGTAYAGFTVTASGGTSAYTYSVASGTLPTGITLNASSGAVSGTPMLRATYASIVLRVTDALSATADLASFTITVAGPATTWDAATVTAVTLSGGNLVATCTGTTSANQGAHVVSTSGKTTGKYYFEDTFTTVPTSGNYGFGVATTTSTYTGLGTNGTTGVMIFKSGNIYSNGTNTGTTLGGRTDNDIVSVAIDLDNRTVWFRNAPSGNWNNSGTANPATNTGGITVPAGTMIPFCTFGGSGGSVGRVQTTNFGASAFSGAVPSGFMSGWPV